jgi:hypothetical protein
MIIKEEFAKLHSTAELSETFHTTNELVQKLQEDENNNIYLSSAQSTRSMTIA